MPDATRPTRSTFFKVVKSVLSFDGSLLRITSHPGGKNLDIIFSYVTSLAYDRMMHTKGPKGKTGLEVLKANQQDWITTRQWLEEMGWGGSEGITSYANFCTTILFNSFLQDDVLESQGEFPELAYRFKEELDYPSEKQMDEAKESNKYFMMAMEDLVDQLPNTLAQGMPQASRSKSSWLPLWEALLGDPLTDIFREEMLIQAKDHFPKLPKEKKSLNVLEIATGTGIATIRLIDMLIDHYSDLDITIHCYEEISNQINRAREKIQLYDKEVKHRYREKNLNFSYKFTVKKYTDPITLDQGSLDVILTFQNLHYQNQGDRYTYFEHLTKLLSPTGVVVVAQTTSYSDLFPHPMSMAYMSVEGFQGYPTVEQVKEVVSQFFKNYKSGALDSIWVLSKPKLA